MKVRLDFQYFDDCPNYDTMRKNLLQAVRGIEDKVEIREIPVVDGETARKVQFRGSPSLLINGEDLEGMPAPEEAALSCRFYPNGIPPADLIRQKIEIAFSEG
jgi:hypothetical protein